MSEVLSVVPATDTSSNIRLRVSALVLLVLYAGLWFGGLGYRDLIQPDEGRYAEIPREMLVTGNWVTPRLDGFKYFEKPPLQYWATAMAYRLFGQSNATARLWTALLGFLSVLWVYVLGLRLYDRDTARYAALILGSGLIWVAMGHIDTLDMGVSALLGFAMGALALAQNGRGDPPRARRWMLAGWAMLALALLSKGLIAVVLPGAAVLCYSLWQRDWMLWKRLHLGKGLLLMAVLSVPWFVLVSRSNPDFLWFFFVHEHFLRYLTPEAGRYEPWWFFPVLLLPGLLPWLGSGLAAVLRRELKWGAGGGVFDVERLLWTYVAVVVTFFSISDSKLVPYILPAYPALALLAGRRLAVRRCLKADALAAVLLGLALIAAGCGIIWLARPALPAALLAQCRPWLFGAGAVLLSGGLVVRWRYSKGLRGATILAVAAVLAFQLLGWGYQALSPVASSRRLAASLLPLAKPGVPVYSIHRYDQALPFYLKREITPVAYRDELSYGIARAPGSLDRPRGTIRDRLVRSNRSGAGGYGARGLYPPADGGCAAASGLSGPGARCGGPAMNLLSLSLILIGVSLNAIAQLALKASVRHLGPIALALSGATTVAVRLLLEPALWLGLACYGISVVVWILALSRVAVSVAYPMLSLGYVLNAVLAWWLFGEVLGATKLTGIGIILLGVFILARG